ncbi:hypothetical protein Scani_36090 [Streptomyces caniferus]|uniref:Uncharacterized protein n=1 Tax=Streptomyces caniferus TaxID=285557 RepID=A0A640SA53_9ACTN|nr:hypothetical protein Scani_36090 [Streptomyces caniferus]
MRMGLLPTQPLPVQCAEAAAALGAAFPGTAPDRANRSEAAAVPPRRMTLRMVGFPLPVTCR